MELQKLPIITGIHHYKIPPSENPQELQIHMVL